MDVWSGAVCVLYLADDTGGIMNERWNEIFEDMQILKHALEFYAHYGVDNGVRAKEALLATKPVFDQIHTELADKIRGARKDCEARG